MSELRAQPALADQIRGLREARHWSQADLARACGLSRAYVKTIEDGHAKAPSARTIGLLSQGLDIDVVDIMQAAGAVPENYRASQIQSELEMVMYLRRQRKLSEEFVNTIMRLIRLAEMDELAEES